MTSYKIRDFAARIRFFSDYIDVRTIVYTILAFVAIVSLIMSGWMYLVKRSDAHSARMYFNNIMELDSIADTVEYGNKLSAFYTETKSPLYRIILGSMLVDHLLSQKKLDDAIVVLNKMTMIRGIPSYISDSIKIRLSSILLSIQKDDYQKKIKNLLLVPSKRNRPFWYLSEEVHLESMYVNGDIRIYKNALDDLSRTSNLPSNMAKRLEELRYIAAHSKY